LIGVEEIEGLLCESDFFFGDSLFGVGLGVEFSTFGRLWCLLGNFGGLLLGHVYDIFIWGTP